MYDVITLGEAMYRLTPPGFQRIAQAASFNIEIGGSEANTAVGLAQLGLQTTWLSRLTDNPLGRRITFDINYRSKLWSSNAASRWHRWPM